MAIHAAAVTDTARRIAGALYRRLESGCIAAAEMMYFRDQGGGRRVLERLSLLPVDLARYGDASAAAPPLTNLAPPTLITGLMGEYVFAQLGLSPKLGPR